MYTTYVLASAALLSTALARTDLSGCTSTTEVVYGGASIAYYVPGTGEICAFLDCGGGAGAPLYDVPGCPLYTGTSTYSPSYMPGYGAPTASPAATSTTAWSSASTSSSAAVTAAAITPATAPSAFPSVYYPTSAQPLSLGNTTIITKVSSSSTTPAAHLNGTAALTGSSSSVAGSGSITSAANPTASASSTSSTFTGAAAMATAKAWAGSAGLVVGIGAVIAAL